MADISRLNWRAAVLAFGLAVAAALQFTGVAHAAKKKQAEDQYGPPMRFAIVRSSTPGCEPLCPEWISAEGTILENTPAELKKILKKVGKRRLPIIVSSPGGRVDAAWTMGRMIRERKLDVGVGKTRFLNCSPDQKGCKLDPDKKGVYAGIIYASGSYCASACPLMFAGGTQRLVGSWAYLGVHQVTNVYTKQQLTYKTKYRIVNGKKKIVSQKVVGRKTVGEYTTTKMGKAQRKKMLAYLKEMGVKETLFEAAQSTPAADMRKLEPAEMLGMNLITSLDGADILTNAALCKAEQPAPNCAKRTISSAKN